MKGHLKHLAMCSPMLLIAIILMVRGVNVAAALLPVVGCVLMMWLMMRGMGHAGHHHRDHSGRPAT